jgi:hypothetical protein
MHPHIVVWLRMYTLSMGRVGLGACVDSHVENIVLLFSSILAWGDGPGVMSSSM